MTDVYYTKEEISGIWMWNKLSTNIWWFALYWGLADKAVTHTDNIVNHDNENEHNDIFEW